MGPHADSGSSFAAHYAECRKRKGLSHAQVCEAGRFYAEVNHGGASVNWERGYNVPTREQWRILQPLLGLSDEYTPLIERIEAEREVIGKNPNGFGPNNGHSLTHGMKAHPDLTADATDEAKKWSGWGTSLKPSWEVILCFRKPLSESSVARNVLKHGTGAINIDESRVGTEQVTTHSRGKNEAYPKRPGEKTVEESGRSTSQSRPEFVGNERSGRWPANLLLSHAPGCQRVGTKRVKANKEGKGILWSHLRDGKTEQAKPNGSKIADPDGTEEVEEFRCVESCPVRELDEQSGVSKSGAGNKNGGNCKAWEGGAFKPHDGSTTGGDQGGASRYFQTFSESFHEPDTGAGFLYKSKASRRERNAGLEGMPERDSIGQVVKKDMKGTAGHGNNNPVCKHCSGSRTDRNNGKGQCSCGVPEWSVPQDNGTTNPHPTVKPIALMSYLVKMVTPPGGIVLDPFAGSGSTLCAAVSNGFEAIGIEAEEEYAHIAERRIAYWSQPEQERAKQKAPKKARNTYGFKSTRKISRCPEHNESHDSSTTSYKCGCALVDESTKDKPIEEEAAEPKADSLF